MTRSRWAKGPQAALLAAHLHQRYARAFRALPVLESRLQQYLPDFWQAYSTLYGTGYERVAEVERLFDHLVEAALARPAALQAVDAAREGGLEWFQTQGQVGMMLYVDLFAGTLHGLQTHIDYFQELGVTYLHLMPLLKPREGPNDGGYAVQDYRQVDPHLGTIDDLRTLASALRQAGLLLVIDFVMNHTAQEHAWAQAALAGDAEKQAFYYLFDDRTLPDQYERTLPEIFPDFAPGNFTFYPEIRKWVWTTFYDFQWDLNYTNPAVFAAVLGEMLFLANLGVDVLRLDAVPFLWKCMGTNCQNQPEAHWLLRAYRALLRMAAPGMLFKSEAIVAPDDIIRYLGTGGWEGRECDIGYNAAFMCHLWHALASENTQLLHTMLARLPHAPEEATWLNYLRCHDDIGWGLTDADTAAVGQQGRATRIFCTDFYTGRLPHSYAEGYPFQYDEGTGEARVSGTAAALAGLQQAQIEADPARIDRAVQRLLLLNSLIFAEKGMPLLYAGDEVGQLNDFSYLLDPLKAIDNRWVHRPPMPWDKAERRHTPGTVEHRLFHGIRRFAQARQHLKPLHGRAAEYVLRTPNDRLFCFERVYDGDRLLVAANFSGQAQALRLRDLPEPWRTPELYDVLAQENVTFPSGHLLFPPYGFFWLGMALDRPPPPLVKTTITLPVRAEWGEEVYLCGNLPALGNQNVAQAAGPLNADRYPFWTIDVEAPAGSYFYFQWIKKRGRQVVTFSPHSFFMRPGDPQVYALDHVLAS
jgi:amylosucrase